MDHLEHVDAVGLFHSRGSSIMHQFFHLQVYLFTFTSIVYSDHCQNHILLFFHLILPSHFNMSDTNFQMFHRNVIDNKREYYQIYQ